MKKVLYILFNKGGCGYYRCFMPAYVLSLNGFEVEFSDYLTSDMIKKYDYIIIQRGFSQNILNIVKEDRNSKVFYEIDDDLLDVYYGHPDHEFYKEKKDIIKKIIENCDGLIVSTFYMKEKYSYFNKKIYLLKNYIMYSENKRRFKKSNAFNILYAGSNTHKKDFDSIKGELEFFLKKNNANMFFLGFKPEKFSNYEYIESVSIFDYIDTIKSLPIDIAIAPLEEESFNLSKSNIKYIEYSICKIPGIYKDYGPYRQISQQNTFKYSTQKDFRNILNYVFKNKEKLKNISENVYKSVNDNFLLNNSIKELEDIFGDVKLKFKFNKKVFDNLKKKFELYDFRNIKFDNNEYYIYGFSNTGKKIYDFLIQNDKKVLGIYDMNALLVPNNLYKDIFKSSNKKIPVIISSKGYSDIIEKNLTESGFINIIKIF